MKSFALTAVLASLLIVGIAGDKCGTEKSSSQVKSSVPNNDLSSFINAQFATSYKYLLLSMNFNTFLKDRVGFSKLFRAESDKLFEDSINLAKHLTSRGYEFNSKARAENQSEFKKTSFEVILNEQNALKKGVSKQKALVEEALRIVDNSDQEIKHYFQENILGDYTKTLRKFSGYYNNLNNFGNNDFKLGVYLFDEYLQKQ